MMPVVYCPTCRANVTLLLPRTRGIEHVAKARLCQDREGRVVAHIFRLSRHPKGGTTTLSISAEYAHD